MAWLVLKGHLLTLTIFVIFQTWKENYSYQLIIKAAKQPKNTRSLKTKKNKILKQNFGK